MKFLIKEYIFFTHNKIRIYVEKKDHIMFRISAFFFRDGVELKEPFYFNDMKFDVILSMTHDEQMMKMAIEFVTNNTAVFGLTKEKF